MAFTLKGGRVHTGKGWQKLYLSAPRDGREGARVWTCNVCEIDAVAHCVCNGSGLFEQGCYTQQVATT